MKKKISLYLSEDVLAELNRSITTSRSRSVIVEEAIRRHLLEPTREDLHARDLELINAAADELNGEALDMLEYQRPNTSQSS